MKVPFLNLAEITCSNSMELDFAYQRVRDSGWFVQGRELESFEAEFAEYCDSKYCVGVGNGLDALYLLLLAYGIGPGDEVVVPSNTFIATWLAVTRCGAKPVAAEPAPDTCNISPEQVAKVLSPRTAAIIPVHLYGQPADIDPINDLARRNGLVVIEDAAQAQGAKYKGRVACSLGNAAATSFYPGKNLGALGDGGAILTNDPIVAGKVRTLRNYGSSEKYIHETLGYNTRLDELQAAFLRAKLPFLNEANAARKRIAAKYLRELTGLPLLLPAVPVWADPVWHLFVIHTQQRNEVRQYLSEKGVETLIHYPIPPHKQICYKEYSHLNLPIAEQLAESSMSLPISPVMVDAQVDYVIECICTFFETDSKSKGI